LVYNGIAMNDIAQPTWRVTPTLCSVETGAYDSYSFDLSGCLVRAAWNQQMVRWGLDGSALVKTLREPGIVACRRTIPPEQGLLMAAEAVNRATQLFVQLAHRLPAAWQPVVAQLITNGIGPMQERALAYAHIYSPVGILPPDQYGAMVLQLTQSCQWNRCSFCSFYKGRPFRVKALPEFTQHIEQVKIMLGPAINRRRSIFLGAASALNLPIPFLLAAFSEMAKTQPALPIYAFMDNFSKGPCQPADFAALARLGLSRIYLGVESGSSTVLRILGKPAETAQLLELAQAIKAGGVALGPIFLLGAGGDLYSHEHVQATAELLANMPLDNEDTVFFSALKPSPTSAYAAWAARNHVNLLHPVQLREQEQLLRQAVQPFTSGGPRLTKYDVEEFIYY